MRPASKVEGEPRGTRQTDARNLRTAQRSQSCRGIMVSLGPEILSMMLRLNHVETVRSWWTHEGVTESIFAQLIPAKEVDFPSCEKVVNMIVEDLDDLGYHRVVFRCDSEPSILALLRAVKLAWTGAVVQETCADGDPKSNGAAESSLDVVKGHVRLIKLALESASGVEVPADHVLLTWLAPHGTSMDRWFSVFSRW